MCMGEQGKGRELKAHPTFIHTLLIKNPMDCVKTNKKEKRMKKHKKNMGEKTVMGTLVKNILLKYEGRLVRAQLGWPPARGAPGRSMVSRCADCWRSRAVRSPSSARSCSWDRFGLRGGSATAARPPRHLVPQTGISWRTPGGGGAAGVQYKSRRGVGSSPGVPWPAPPPAHPPFSNLGSGRPAGKRCRLAEPPSRGRNLRLKDSIPPNRPTNPNS